MENGFLAEINTHPKDDYYKMIYTDWLKEIGDDLLVTGIEWLIMNGRQPYFDDKEGDFVWFANSKLEIPSDLLVIIHTRLHVRSSSYNTYIEAYLDAAQAASELIAEGKLAKTW